eukprot:CCRYP_006715-RA/>CCRYP_006715-RA protein AED:0.05 eAED:0.05 QI:269/1/1/1/1/1/2/124/799
MSTILYKFRSSTNYTPLHLPGTSARLLDIKRAICRDKNLGSSNGGAPSSLEFDLQISNAATDEVYDDENAIVPRGTRVVVRRVACERGGGILNRLANAGMDGGGGAAGEAGRVAKSEFYTFREGGEEEDEFVDDAHDESRELEALKAVTDQAGEVFSGQRGWSGGPPPRGVAGAPHFPKPPPKQPAFRPDADPELRQQQQQQQQQLNKTKKRATGIPRTFLSEAPARVEGDAAPDGSDETGGDLASTLLPNTLAFQSLIARSGGQSQTDKTNNLSYALKLTATPLPEHLTCGICSSLVNNPMLVPWDDAGRPACESCIRDGLLQNGYKCPMTGIEGVSPEDLFPNVGLRKAAELFQKSVWEKMESMERQIEEERRAEEEKERERMSKGEDEFEDVGEGIVKGKNTKKGDVKKKRNVDEFGEDEFGGDVFDVVSEENDDEEDAVEDPNTLEKHTQVKQQAMNTNDNHVETSTTNDNHNKMETTDDPNVDGNKDGKGNVKDGKNPEDNATNNDNAVTNSSTNSTSNEKDTAEASTAATATARKREAPKRRGPPPGYVLGPAGAGMMAPAPTVMFGVNVPPPPPPPPRPIPVAPVENNVGTNNVIGTNDGSRSGSIDPNAPPTTTMDATPPPGNELPGTPPPMMGRGRGDGRFSGRFPNDFSRGGGFQGRGRYINSHNPQYPQGAARGGYRDYGRGGRGAFQGRGGFDRGQQGHPPNPNWGSNEDWNRKRPREVMEGDPSVLQDQQQGWGGGRGHIPQYNAGGRFDGRGRFPGRDVGGRGRFEGRGGWRGGGGGRAYGRGRY